MTRPGSPELSELRLRTATAVDEQLTWEWANDPDVRRLAFTTEAIPRDVHSAWFAAISDDPARHLFIAEGAAGPIGVIRFEARADDVYEISITIGPGFRGRGLAPTLILRSLEELAARTGEVRVRALIKPGNVPSIAAFGRAGFTDRGTTSHRGTTALVYERRAAQTQAADSASSASTNRAAPPPSTRA